MESCLSGLKKEIANLPSRNGLVGSNPTLSSKIFSRYDVTAAMIVLETIVERRVGAIPTTGTNDSMVVESEVVEPTVCETVY